MNLGERLPENPLLTARDVKPSLPTLEVVSVFNAAAARVGDEIILLLRVAERPRTDIAPEPDDLTADVVDPLPRSPNAPLVVPQRRSHVPLVVPHVTHHTTQMFVYAGLWSAVLALSASAPRFTLDLGGKE